MSDASTLERPADTDRPAAETPVLLGLLAEVTHRCPLQCPYCSNPVALDAPNSELSATEWGRVFREAAALGALQLHLSGGEPLARRDIVDIVAEARAADLYINLITAAVNLSPERADALVAAGVDHVQVSLQDATSEGCGAITNMKGAFEKKRAACALVTERGLPLTLNAVVHRHNLDNVERMIAIAVELGAHRLEIANTQYYGWALANRAALMPRPEQVAKAGEIVDAARERLRGTLNIDYVAPDYYARYPKPCMGGWGQQFLAITPSGAVMPCHAAASIPNMAFDNVKTTPLGDIWRASEAFQRFRGTDWMREPCRSCARKDEDFGGCRCQAMMVTGDAANTDPVCVLSPHRAALDAALAEATAADTPPAFTWRRYAKGEPAA
ncbi:pyrroloquinoline quinone biosynthesis protein PqqE [Acuticoccus yangtzensis]|uniref:pyrroloquinoline quinone biosynthesis protein PqqE n=1 Tax=Acuticoccus yangtzensis TaxID=1443441 RepID=UPI0009499287|nr:pyrroloquinoline quinone biosynthesis protein PqqE [Acuticoccus yangtzensis]